MQLRNGFLCLLVLCVVLLGIIKWLENKEIFIWQSSGSSRAKSAFVDLKGTTRPLGNQTSRGSDHNNATVSGPQQPDNLTSSYYYTDPLRNVPAEITFDSLPIPIQVMEQYRKWHSVEALRSNPDLEHRKFAIGFYACPIQAGNRLHHFFNCFLWAIITNRTLLWQYWDDPTCMYWSGQKHICRSMNRVQDCDQILSRADWIPSYDEWSKRLALEQPSEIPYFATHPTARRSEILNERLVGADNRTKYFMQVAAFGINTYQLDFLESEEVRNALLHTETARETCLRLFSLGINFLYGMLHRYSFAFAEQARKGLVGYQTPPANTFTVALHSRHRVVEDDGCNVKPEIQCLKEVVPRRKHKPVQVLIMADRICTVTKLSKFLKSKNMTMYVAPHDEGESFSQEHGPFAGVGFYQDLALVSQARSAIVATSRTSSYLLRELVEYHRQMQWWNTGHDITTIDPPMFCHLPGNYKSFAELAAESEDDPA
jgi:hypothetical protein